MPRVLCYLLENRSILHNYEVSIHLPSLHLITCQQDLVVATQLRRKLFAATRLTPEYDALELQCHMVDGIIGQCLRYIYITYLI